MPIKKLLKFKKSKEKEWYSRMLKQKDREIAELRDRNLILMKTSLKQSQRIEDLKKKIEDLMKKLQ